MELSRLAINLKRVAWEKPALLAAGLLLLGWLLNTPAGLLGKADAIGYAVCHRIDARSFHLGDRHLPLRARCTGMYLGAMVGLAYQAVISRRRASFPPRRSLQQLVLPLAGGFGIALLQIASLDVLRYIFTGTWDGFHLGSSSS